MFPTETTSRHGTSPTGGVDAVVRVMQIIRIALVLGVVMFGGVVVFLKLSGNAAQGPVIPNPLFPNFPLLLLIAAPFAVSCILASFVIPGVQESRVRRELATGEQPESEWETRLLAGHQTASVLRGALLEGPSLFLLITSMIEGHWWGLMWAGGLQVLQLATMPTRSSVTDWLRTQKELIRLDQVG